MKKLFYIGILLLLVFEIAKVYLIMPFPGSQQSDTVTLAHFLHTWRWAFRGVFILVALSGVHAAWKSKKWLSMGTTIFCSIVITLIQLKLSADKMFLPLQQLTFLTAADNRLPENQLVIGIEYEGEARAYPIQLIAYHHQVIDTLGGKPVMVTYCSVCRTGRVFAPLVNGKQENFRLVGMDQFNALFEDASTGSWWRQATGEAVAGPCKGQSLPELPTLQTSLATWLRLHPNSRILQPDPHFTAEYVSMADYEGGHRRGGLTGRDTTTGAAKSWIVGIETEGGSKAYDWNRLQRERIVHDQIGDTPIVVVLASDDQSFFAFARAQVSDSFLLRQDTLVGAGDEYSLEGVSYHGGNRLRPLKAYQEFLHSWRSFHPEYGVL
jgi:hypothetical protein